MGAHNTRNLLPIAVALLAACSGDDGCSCLGNTPGGFPLEERIDNAVQFRMSETGLEALENDPNALVASLLGNEDLEIPIEPDCDGDICCPGGTPNPDCGPIRIDLERQPADEPRLELAPQTGLDRLDVTLRARMATSNPLDVRFLGSDCTVEFDTTLAQEESTRIEMALAFTQDPTLGTTRIEIADLQIEDLHNGDITIDGGLLCAAGDALLFLVRGVVIGGFEDALRGTLEQQLCTQTCESGNVAECGPGADTCEDGVCMRAGACVQELGIAGRLTTSLLRSPGSVDIYEVAGGYATTEQDGLSLGILGGALPAGTPNRCGPPSTPPPAQAVPISQAFQGNRIASTGEPFDFAIGLHEHNLDVFSHAAYESGLLCLNVETQTVPLLNTTTVGLLFASVNDLLHGQAAQLRLGLRPQKPPTFTIGAGITDDDGNIVDPLLNVFFEDLEIDFFAMVDDQFSRLVTFRMDLELPANLEIDPVTGEFSPLLGDIEDGLTLKEVLNFEALNETEEQLAAQFPSLLALVGPQLSSGLGSFALPAVAGLEFDINKITSADNNTFVAIYGDVTVGEGVSGPASPQALRIDTQLEILDSYTPPTSSYQSGRLAQDSPSVRIRLSASQAGVGLTSGVEYSVRIDDGVWRPYTRKTELVLDNAALWFQGRHRIEARARKIHDQKTTDLSPAQAQVTLDTLGPKLGLSTGHGLLWLFAQDNVTQDAVKLDYQLDGTWHDVRGSTLGLAALAGKQITIRATDPRGNATTEVLAIPASARPSTLGCQADDSSATPWWLFAVIALVALRRKRIGQRSQKPYAYALGLLACAALLPACGSSTQCAQGACQDGEVRAGPSGRYNSIAASADRTVVAAYDQDLGDLLFGERTTSDDVDTFTFTPIAGVPTDNLPVYDPKGYRGGIVEPGADVGRYTDIALRDGHAYIAFQDVDRQALMFASETDDGWHFHDIDIADDGVELGAHAHLSYGPDGLPAVAYLASGLGDAGTKTSQLRYARASTATPTQRSDWTTTVIEEVEVSCAGLCGTGELCASLPSEPVDVERCVVATQDCSDTCGDRELCYQGSCVASVAAPVTYDLPRGSGLFVTAVYLDDGSTALVHYDRTAQRLVTHVGSSESWTRSEIAGDDTSEAGVFASAIVSPDGLIHAVYQDGLRGQLFYARVAVTNSQVTSVTIEVIDNGQRQGDRPHLVGSGATISLDRNTGEPVVVYQDGSSNDMLFARRSEDGQWNVSDLQTGPHLYGFFIDTATNDQEIWVSSYFYDRDLYPFGRMLLTVIP